MEMISGLMRDDVFTVYIVFETHQLVKELYEYEFTNKQDRYSIISIVGIENGLVICHEKLFCVSSKGGNMIFCMIQGQNKKVRSYSMHRFTGGIEVLLLVVK